MAKVISSRITEDATAIAMSKSRLNSRNQLEGIALTDAVHTILHKAIDLAATLKPPEASSNADHAEKDDEKDLKGDCDHHEEDADHNVNALLDQMRALSNTTNVPSIKEAISILNQKHAITRDETTTFISVPEIRAIETIFDYYDKINGNTTLSMEFEHVMQELSTSLVYSNSLLKEEDNDDSIEKITKNTSHLTKEQRKFQLRMRQLRLQNEERKYMKITNNVNKFNIANMNDDNITTKSMTYAASIGLNMIVAPITFGVFMYFFAGSLFDYFWPISISTHQHHHHHSATAVDVKKVIAGVISGVMMLFIEMILFVIRTHEMDKAMLKKRKKQGHMTSLSPFGHYKSTTAKSYVDH